MLCVCMCVCMYVCVCVEKDDGVADQMGIVGEKATECPK